MTGANQYSRRLTVGFIAAFFAFAFTISGSAQTIRPPKDILDSSLRSNFNVDPATLNMSFGIKLGEFPGRGTNIPVSLDYSSKVWEILFNTTYEFENALFTESFANYARTSVSGWNVNMGVMGVPVLDTRGSYAKYTTHGEPLGNTTNGLHIDQIAFRLPDGSTRELRKSDIPVGGAVPLISGIYVAVDDPRMKYDADNKVLYMPDGSRYIFNCCPGGVQYVQYVDRNGNVMNYNTQDGWTDTLGRRLGVSLNNSLESGQQSKQQNITLPGPNGATHTYTLVWKNLDKVLSSGGGVAGLSYVSDFSYPGGPTYAPSLFRSFTPDQINGGYIFNPVVLSDVILPNGQKYSFTYNVYGEIDKIQLPTGGYHKYEYEIIPALDNTISAQAYGQANRGVIQHSISESGNASDERTWLYSVNPIGAYVVTETRPDNTRIERYIHRENDAGFQNFGLNDVRTGRVYDERLYTAGNIMIRRTLTKWDRDIINYPPGIETTKFATRRPRPVRIVEILLDTDGNALSKTTTMNYDADLNATASSYYDYIPIDPSLAQAGAIDSIPQGALLKAEELTYLVNDPDIDQWIRDGYRSRNLISLPTKNTVKDGSGRVVSAVQNKYDESEYPLTTYPAVVNWADPQTPYRGIVTTARIWLSDDPGSPSAWGGWSAGNWITTHSWYDQCGNVVRKRDGRGSESTFSYSDNFDGVGAQNSYAYLTSASNALGHTTSSKYDYKTGLVVESVDPNGTITRNENSDPFDRPTRLISAYGTNIQSQQTIQYDDANKRIITTSDLDVYGDNKLRSEIVYDGLGRAFESRTYENATSYVRSLTEYDALGRPYRSSNPHRPGESIAWTTTAYDSLGRIVNVETPDGAHTITQYNGAKVTVTDQAGKKRLSETDALGRVVKVTEDPGGLNYDTIYFYDPSGNLRYVGQGEQGRWFSYDSLSRPIRVRNPEQDINYNLPPHTDPYTGGDGWSTAYTYDANGNVIERADARNIKITYGYDALNRNTTVDYNNTAVNPDITRVYDNSNPGTNGKGRFWHDYAGGHYAIGQNVDHKAIDSYDALGRPLSVRRHFKLNGTWSEGFITSQTYDLAGNLKTQTYPSGHTTSYSYNTAGQLTSYSGTLGDGLSRNYATITQYNPAGQKERESYGTGANGMTTPLYLKLLYNKRHQLVDLRLGSVNDGVNLDRGALQFYYGLIGAANQNPSMDEPNNNGNVVRQWSYVPKSGGGFVTTQLDDYSYDPLNRLATFTEGQINESGTFAPNVAAQTLSYDRYGNRRVTSATGGVSAYNPTYNTWNNRIDGLGYDAAGNITSDPLTGGTMTYDAESRLLTATNGSGGSYTYEADGKRVRRTAAGQQWWYVYGVGGELVAEYLAGAAPAAVKKEYGYRGGQLLITADGGSTTNLAFGKTATQSSTDWGGVADRGVDGNTNGNWGNNSVTHTTVQNQPWWQVDLGSVQQIGAIKVWNRTDCCGERLSNFYVLVSDTPFISTDLATTINQAGVSSYYVAGPVATATEAGVYRSGRYVRVQLAGTNALSVAEVEVRGGTGIQWLVTDHLGSTRMVIDQTGSLSGVKRHDYAPFGEELTAGIRSAGGYGYVGSNARQKFGSNERDIETGLDFVGARYFASIQGRFISSDPVMMNDDRLTDPQRWNLYAYCLNNPLKYVDPDGEDAIVVAFTDYKIAGPGGIKLPYLGHAGIVLVDKRGRTTYFEYGRYDKAQRGLVRRIKVPNLVMKNGRPTDKSLQNLLGFLSGKYKNSAVEGAYFVNDSLAKMMKHAVDTEKKNSDPKREEYATFSNNCMTFCKETLEAGGVDTPAMVDPRPNSYIDELQDVDTFSVTYNPKKKKITISSIIGTENDPAVQAIRRQYSVIGSNPIQEDEALYEYRVRQAFDKEHK